MATIDTTTTPAEAPLYIERDTHKGRWTVQRRAGSPTAARYAVDVYTAGELAALAPQGIIWESAGHMRSGAELFGRTRYVADAEGNLHCYDSTGRKVVVHPAGRQLRILTTR